MSTRIKRKRKIMSEMNLTPLIDVMLVLLVIFMITAPLLTVGVKVDLPKVAAASVNDNDTPLVIFINSTGQIFIGDVQVDLDSLPEKLRAMTDASITDPKVFIKGDKSLNYGTVMNVMGRVNTAGFKKVVLVTDMPTGTNAVSRHKSRK